MIGDCESTLVKKQNKLGRKLRLCDTCITMVTFLLYVNTVLEEIISTVMIYAN